MPSSISQKRNCISCTPKARRHLCAADPKMAAWIAQIGPIRREASGRVFEDLLRNIASQQISGAVADSIWKRLRAACGRGAITPKRAAALRLEDLRACGLSRRKAEYIQGIALAAVEGRVDFKRLHLLDDAQIAEQLLPLRGVGLWTVQMLLLFSLGRPDVFSFGDYGIRKGLMLLYGKKTIGKKDFERYRRRYSPYGSLASLYVWARANFG